jgi:hypothetical protein
MIFETTLSSQRLKSGVFRVNKLHYQRSLIWLRFVLFCSFVLLSGPSTLIGQRVSSLDFGVSALKYSIIHHKVIFCAKWNFSEIVRLRIKVCQVTSQ